MRLIGKLVKIKLKTEPSNTFILLNPNEGGLTIERQPSVKGTVIEEDEDFIILQISSFFSYKKTMVKKERILSIDILN